MTLPIGLSAPPDFPTADLNDLHAVVTARVPQGPLLEQYLAALNAVCFRYLSAVDDNTEFVGLVNRFGDTPGPPERYRQERALFAFYANAFSLFESFGYLGHHVAASIRPAAFSLDPAVQGGISFRTTARLYAQEFPQEAISRELGRVAKGHCYAELSTIRHVLSHRTAPGRGVFLTNVPGRSPPTVWKLSIHGMSDIVLAAAATENRLLWIDAVLPILISTLAAFARARVCATSP